MPSVVFFNRVYPPNPGATGTLLQELAEDLVAGGWKVTVVASGLPGNGIKREERNGVSIRWIRVGPFNRHTRYRRAVSDFLVLPRMLRAGLFLPRHDAMVLLTDPPLLCSLGMLLRWRHGGCTGWHQDLYPEVAEVLGVLPKGGVLARFFRSLSNIGLNVQKRCVVVGRDMAGRIIDRGIAPERVTMISNWVNSERLLPIDRHANSLRRDLGLENSFVLMYSGNLGLAHTFDPLLKAASIVEAKRSDVTILLAGVGTRREEVERQVQKEGLTSVRLVPPFPAERLGEALGIADLHIVTLRDGLEGLVVPSKLYGGLSVGRPALFLGPQESEVAYVLKHWECGTTVSSGKPEEIAAAILAWADDPRRHQQACQNARKAAIEHDRTRSVSQWQQLLQEVTTNGR